VPAVIPDPFLSISMLETITTSLVALAGIYVLIGILVGLGFIFRGAGRLDPSAVQGSWGFRVLIFPGTVALWPILARRWALATRNRP